MQATSVEDTVRRRLRALRVQQSLTLQDVTSGAGIDVSTLSRLESGKRRLALDHLPRLAAALSVSTDELLRDPKTTDPRVRGDSQTFRAVTYWPLTRHRSATGRQTFIVRISQPTQQTAYRSAHS